MAALSSPQAAPPTPQEVSRKLSISHKSPKPRKVSLLRIRIGRCSILTSSLPLQKPTINIPHSGTESDSDSYSQNQLSPDASASFTLPPSILPSGIQQPQLSAIDEGESDGDEDEDEGEGGVGWRSVYAPQADEEAVVKAGYLWKKGLRRKVGHIDVT